MAEVQEICSEHNIDLDDESEPSSSQAIRAEILDEEEEIDLEDLIGTSMQRSIVFCYSFFFNQMMTVMKKKRFQAMPVARGSQKRTSKS